MFYCPFVKISLSIFPAFFILFFVLSFVLVVVRYAQSNSVNSTELLFMCIHGVSKFRFCEERKIDREKVGQYFPKNLGL